MITALIVAALGVYFIILFFATSKDGTSPSVAAIGVLFIIVSAYCAVLTVKPLIFRQKQSDPNALLPVAGKESLVSRNNKMIDEYDKTANARNKMKVLQAAATAEE